VFVGAPGACDRLSIVFVLVAIQAEQFPVAAIWWIVVVVMVLMMDREFTQFLALKLPPASCADRRK
jgi:hypothetical protein